MEDRTVEQVVLKLAERMVPCPGVPNEPGEGIQGGGKTCEGGMLYNLDDTINGQCDICHGTGKVAKFPMLRELWYEPHTHIKSFDPYADHDRHKSIIVDSKSPDIAARCAANRSRGWHPVTTTEALLEAGKPHDILVGWDSQLNMWGANTSNPPSLPQYDTDKRMALALALEAVQEQEASDARADRAPSP